MPCRPSRGNQWLYVAIKHFCLTDTLGPGPGGHIGVQTKAIGMSVEQFKKEPATGGGWRDEKIMCHETMEGGEQWRGGWVVGCLKNVSTLFK